MKLVPLRDNPQFLKGFYLRTRFPEVIFEPVLAALVLVVFLVLWTPMGGGPLSWKALVLVLAGMQVCLALLLAPLAVVRLTLLDRMAGVVDFYRASPLPTRNHLVGLVLGGVFPEWLLGGALFLLFLPIAHAAGIPWHLSCAFAASLLLSSLVLALGLSGSAAGNARTGGEGLIVFVLMAYGMALLFAGKEGFGMWIHAAGAPVVRAVLTHHHLTAGEGYGLGQTLVLVGFQAAMQLPLLLLGWVSLWRGFRGPRWHNGRKFQALLLSVYVFCCLLPGGGWSVPQGLSTARVGNGVVMRDPEETNAEREVQDYWWQHRGMVVVCGGLAAALLLGTMAAATPARGETVRGMRRALKTGARRAALLDDWALNPPVMVGVSLVSLLAIAAFHATGVVHLTAGAACWLVLVFLGCLWFALLHQYVQLRWGSRARQMFILFVLATWVILPLVALFNPFGMILSPFLPFGLLLANFPSFFDAGTRGEWVTPATFIFLAADLMLVCVFSGILWAQYRRVCEAVSGKRPDGKDDAETRPLDKRTGGGSAPATPEVTGRVGARETS